MGEYLEVVAECRTKVKQKQGIDRGTTELSRKPGELSKNTGELTRNAGELPGKTIYFALNLNLLSKAYYFLIDTFTFCYSDSRSECCSSSRFGSRFLAVVALLRVQIYQTEV